MNTSVQTKEVSKNRAVDTSLATRVPQAEAEALFADAKKAVLGRDYNAFLKLMHPWAHEIYGVELAKMFTVLVNADMSQWKLGPVQDGADGPYASVLNASEPAVAAFDYDGETLKLLALGYFHF